LSEVLVTHLFVKVPGPGANEETIWWWCYPTPVEG